ncbi:MAG: HAD-IA family hydrolase [Acidobacteriota bacterium]
MNFADFQVLMFDCYGTLINWEPGILSELRPWVLAHGRQLADDEILRGFGAVELRHEAAMPTRLYPAVLAATFHELGRRWQIPTTDAEAAAFGASVGRWTAFPDSAPSLRYLKQYHKLVILSDVDRASFAKTNEQLQVEFDRIITAEEVGSYKPDLANFEYAVRTIAKMGVTPDRILHVAESLYHDIAPAKSMGLRAVWVQRRIGRMGMGPVPPKPGAAPDLEVRSLAELVELHRAQRRG